MLGAGRVSKQEGLKLSRQLKLRFFVIFTATLIANMTIAIFWQHYPVIIFEILSALSVPLSFWFAAAVLLHGIRQQNQLVALLKYFAVIGTVLVYLFLVLVLFFTAEGLYVGNMT